VNRKNIYLFLCVLGAAIPYSQFVPWVMENGLPLGLLARQLFANRISAFFGLDVLLFRSPLGIHAYRGAAAPDRIPLASDSRAMRSWSEPGVPVVSLSSRTRNGRITGNS